MANQRCFLSTNPHRAYRSEWNKGPLNGRNVYLMPFTLLVFTAVVIHTF